MSHDEAGIGGVSQEIRRASEGEPQPMQIVQKREFLDRVATAAGVRKTDARAVVDATLEQLGHAFACGETLALPPFGRARVTRKTDEKGAEVIVLRLRRKIGED